MQTFLPYDDYLKCAACLDDKRLGKQRSESKIILKTLLGMYEKPKGGWPHHPATKMWTGHELSLCLYSLAITREWRNRGHEDTTLSWFLEVMQGLEDTGDPPWLGYEPVHTSHRSNLLRKMPEWYSQFGWQTDPDLPYVWPSKLERFRG